MAMARGSRNERAPPGPEPRPALGASVTPDSEANEASGGHTVKRAAVLFLALSLGSSGPVGSSQEHAESLLEARDGFATKLLRRDRHTEELVRPPSFFFRLVEYPTSLGPMKAYLSQPRDPDAEHPAIIWITGGFPAGGIGASAWEPQPPSNDQSAKSYQEAGVVMMYPTLRGSFGNPGAQEGFFGEVDDVVAAADYLSGLEFVDPERIFLGGHSTGGTLVLLVAAATDRFHTVFSFGPVATPLDYGVDWPFDASDATEVRLRSPIRFLDAIRTPTLVIEGDRDGNAASLRALRGATESPKIEFLLVEGADHFNVLAPANALLAERVAGSSRDGSVRVPAERLREAVSELRTIEREADDLQTLADIRREGADIGSRQTLWYFVSAWEEAPLEPLAEAAEEQRFRSLGIETYRNSDGDVYYEVVLSKPLVPGELDELFRTSRTVSELCDRHGADYDGWWIE